MNERYQEILQKMLTRLDLVATGLLVVLIISVGYLFLREQGYELSEPPPPQRKEWNVQIPSPEYEKIADSHVHRRQSIEEDEVIQRAVLTNMFDLRSVREEAQSATELNTEYNRAEQLYRQNRYEEALSIVESILDRDPNHRSSRELRERIETARQG